MTNWEHLHATRQSWGIWPAEYMVRAVASYEGPRLAALDIGTGGGAHIRLLEEAGFKNVWANDISQTAVDRVRATARDSSLIACGDINTMVYPEGEFDVIIDNLSLTHVKDPNWERIIGWLRPGGQLMTAWFNTSDPSFPEWWSHGELEDIKLKKVAHERHEVTTSRSKMGWDFCRSYALFVHVLEKPL